MRSNLPITGQEYPFPKGETLVSVTDLKGRILYCNEMFAYVSGFEMDELLGQPHNIIRHPEIPEEAFRDLWETIQNGRPWSAVVKNRRKDGSHYWVLANVTPLSDESGLTGYMSVRTEAMREQIHEAEALFDRMHQEKEAGRVLTVFRNGRAVRLTLPARVMEALHIDLSAKLLLCLVVLAGLVGGLAWWGGRFSLPPAWLAACGAARVTAVWLLLRRWIVAPVDALIVGANRIAACDLTQVILRDRKDRYGELQAALGQMSVNVMSIVRDARERSTRMCTSMQIMSRDNGELAQRTQQQATDLQQTAVELAAGEIAELITETTARIGDGHQKTESTLSLMRDAVSSIQKVHAMVDDIDQAAAEQLNGISRINTAISNLDEATGANVTFAARMADATHELESLAEATSETVRVFRIDSSRRETQDAVELRRRAKGRATLAVAHAPT